MRPIERLQQNLAISVPTLSQIAAEAAFDGRDEMEAVKHGYEENRRILIEGLPKAGLDKFLPVDGAFYLYADVSRFTDDSFDFAKRMLEEADVAATPGVDFDPVRRQALRPLLLCRLGRRHARGGGADRRLAASGCVTHDAADRVLRRRQDSLGQRSSRSCRGGASPRRRCAACALVLVAGGRLDLDRAIAGRKFTLRQLLQHTSGLGCYTDIAGVRGGASTATKTMERRSVARIDRARGLTVRAGTGWKYSNSGYFLVARAIEQATGMELECALKSMVLGPLGIEKTFIARTRADMQRSVLGGEDNFHPGWVAHGLLMGPPSDVVAFMHRLLTGTLLPAPLLAAMREPRPVEAISPAGRGGPRAMVSA